VKAIRADADGQREPVPVPPRSRRSTTWLHVFGKHQKRLNMCRRRPVEDKREFLRRSHRHDRGCLHAGLGGGPFLADQAKTKRTYDQRLLKHPLHAGPVGDQVSATSPHNTDTLRRPARSGSNSAIWWGGGGGSEWLAKRVSARTCLTDQIVKGRDHRHSPARAFPMLGWRRSRARRRIGKRVSHVLNSTGRRIDILWRGNNRYPPEQWGKRFAGRFPRDAAACAQATSIPIPRPRMSYWAFANVCQQSSGLQLSVVIRPS